MKTSRRSFLGGAAWMGVAAVAGGCLSVGKSLNAGGSMSGFAVPPLKRIRVGIIGLGMRGEMAVRRLAAIPGVEVRALCDLLPERVSLQQKVLRDAGRPKAREYVGREAYRELCGSDLDVVYIVTPWDLHTPVALEAMENGKHALVEVPSALTLDDCWALVECAERTRRHCMQLENCCYGEAELFCLNIVRKGLLGELVHGEGAYIHDLRDLCYGDADPSLKKANQGYVDHWRLRQNQQHRGNQYETHGLGPICEYMNINRGDRFDTLVSLESGQYGFELYGRTKFKGHPWKENLKVAMGDVNTTLIRTVNGKSILVQHDVSSPRPYSRLNSVVGTRGAFEGILFVQDPATVFDRHPNACRFGWGEKDGDAVHRYFDHKKTLELREKYRHPLWRREISELAQRIGGHGGMDFIMDLRWAYCLQNGLPLDMDVYDLATWCSLGELTERSVRSGSTPQAVPDFTRGAWRTARPFGIVDIDLRKMGFTDTDLKVKA